MLQSSCSYIVDDPRNRYKHQYLGSHDQVLTLDIAFAFVLALAVHACDSAMSLWTSLYLVLNLSMLVYA